MSMRAYGLNTAQATQSYVSIIVSNGASVCICHYILGVGDRHLNNFMVGLNDGKLIGELVL